jgi:hypothetical protein
MWIFWDDHAALMVIRREIEKAYRLVVIRARQLDEAEAQSAIDEWFWRLVLATHVQTYLCGVKTEAKAIRAQGQSGLSPPPNRLTARGILLA